MRKCFGQSADDDKAAVLPQLYRPLIAGNNKIELHCSEAAFARSLQRMRAHRPCHSAPAGVGCDDKAAIGDVAAAAASVSAGDEPHFVDRGAPEGSCHAGRCVPYHASVSSITSRKASPP